MPPLQATHCLLLVARRVLGWHSMGQVFWVRKETCSFVVPVGQIVHSEEPSAFT